MSKQLNWLQLQLELYLAKQVNKKLHLLMAEQTMEET